MRYCTTTLGIVLLLSVSLLGIFCSRPSDESLVIQGRFTVHHGPSFKGGVVLRRPSLYRAVTLDSVSALSGGSFVLPVREKGVYKFVFAASGYPDLEVPLYIENSVGISIDLPDDTTSLPRIVFDNKSTHTAQLYDIYVQMTSYRPGKTGLPPGSAFRTSSQVQICLEPILSGT